MPLRTFTRLSRWNPDGIGSAHDPDVVQGHCYGVLSWHVTGAGLLSIIRGLQIHMACEEEMIDDGGRGYLMIEHG